MAVCDFDSLFVPCLDDMKKPITIVEGSLVKTTFQSVPACGFHTLCLVSFSAWLSPDRPDQGLTQDPAKGVYVAFVTDTRGDTIISISFRGT